MHIPHAGLSVTICISFRAQPIWLCLATHTADSARHAMHDAHVTFSYTQCPRHAQLCLAYSATLDILSSNAGDIKLYEYNWGQVSLLKYPMYLNHSTCLEDGRTHCTMEKPAQATTPLPHLLFVASSASATASTTSTTAFASSNASAAASRLSLLLPLFCLCCIYCIYHCLLLLLPLYCLCCLYVASTSTSSAACTDHIIYRNRSHSRSARFLRS